VTLDCSAPYHSASLDLQGLQYKDTGFDDRTSPSCPRAPAQTSLLRYRLTYVGTTLPPPKVGSNGTREPSSSASLPRSLAACHQGPWHLSTYFRSDIQADRQQAKAQFRQARGRLSQEGSCPGKSEVCTCPGLAQPSTNQLQGLFPPPKVRRLGARESQSVLKFTSSLPPAVC